MRTTSSHIRNFWQSHIGDRQNDKSEIHRSVPAKPYSFPRWRSSDALSASLVASKNVEIPTDSIIPEERLQKMRETERIAQIDKFTFTPKGSGAEDVLLHIKEEDHLILPSIVTFQSMIHCSAVTLWVKRKACATDEECENTEMYDRKKIRESISRESIANIAKTRERFEMKRVTEPSKGFPDEWKDASTKSYDHSYSDEEQLLLLYMKQNPEIISSECRLHIRINLVTNFRRFESFDKVEEACQEFFDSKSKERYFDHIRKLTDRWQDALENDEFGEIPSKANHRRSAHLMRK
ncbi:hypothetical protein KIN20_009182 [Parelaphostrongylus tenuis]|uniref:Uncharacterized protein n=1 Tax=Parelaphostrongylus tenuis TaxID=148309 RepID=A0AAD5MAS9_PARTN|nr:hypothetical protein KIN20_009182 [Parelaphostrongylus tenuis]